MSEGRSYSDAVSTGGGVWVTGGWNGQERHRTSELLTEVDTGWRAGPDISNKRYQHCGVTLADGSVVLTGGQIQEEGGGRALDLVERWAGNTKHRK